MTPTGPRPTTTTVEPGRDGGPERADVARREDVGQEHGLLVGHALGDGQGELVGEGDGDRFGLAAGEVGHGPERGGLAGQAEVGEPGGAGPHSRRSRPRPRPGRGRRHGRLHVRADLGHRADGLVAQPDAGAGRGVVVQVQIRAADGGAFDRDDDALGPGSTGSGTSSR